MGPKKKSTEDASMEKVSFYMDAELLEEYKQLAKDDRRSLPDTLRMGLEIAKKIVRERITAANEVEKQSLGKPLAA